MQLGRFEYYLIIVNVIGFVLYLVNFWLYTYTPDGQIDRVLTITSLLGGSLGIVIAILLFDRKAVKFDSLPIIDPHNATTTINMNINYSNNPELFTAKR